LIAGSLLWTSSRGPAPRWSTAQAQQYQQAGAEYHRLSHQQAHRKPHAHGASATQRPGREEQVAKLAAARTRWQEQARQLAVARSDHQRRATQLKWSGIALASASLVGLLVVRSHSQP
jgi:hypothetical protein